MIVLVGKSCSGKDTIAKKLIKNNSIRIVTYTTRPPRPHERNGVDYYFVSEEKFKELIKQDFFAEYKEYEVSSGKIWYYGSSKKDYIGNKFIILTPSGLKDIKQQGVDVISFLIEADNEVIKERMKIRGDKKEEAIRRFKSDEKDFKGIEKEVDFTIINNGKYPTDVLAEIILSAARGKK